MRHKHWFPHTIRSRVEPGALVVVVAVVVVVIIAVVVNAVFVNAVFVCCGCRRDCCCAWKFGLLVCWLVG